MSLGNPGLIFSLKVKRFLSQILIWYQVFYD